MPRYFIEVSYKGTNYSGFQVQQNANSIQAEVEKALQVFFKQKFELTGSSRTDAGVHALQNFFHFDSETAIHREVYNLNAILPDDIVIKSINEVDVGAHCRFDAVSREYRYHVYQNKQPFIQDRAYYYPYALDIQALQQVAKEIILHHDFTSFSKRNTQVRSFLCEIYESEWVTEQDCLVYRIKANRFLRGMVKGLVGTMLQAGRGKLSVDGFRAVIEGRDCTKADFSVPSHGLFLCKVEYR
jgi:tRNA pseudouridine38-40 synthase